MVKFFNAPENAMMHYSLPGDSDEARAASPLTPFGRRHCAVDETVQAPAPQFTRLAEPSVYEHCAGSAQVARAFEDSGGVIAGATESNEAAQKALAGIAPKLRQLGDHYDDAWKNLEGSISSLRAPRPHLYRR